MFSRIVLALLGVALLVGPVGASAQWDYLFEDLSWTAEGTVGGAGEWSFGTGAGTQISGTFNYLFEDLSWPDGIVGGSGTVDSGFADIASGGSADSGSFFDYLFEDIEWPAAAGIAGGGM